MQAPETERRIPVKATPATEVCSSCMKEPAPRPFSARWTGSGRKHSAATNRKSARRPGNWPGPFSPHSGESFLFLFCKVFLPPPLRMAKVFWNYGSYLRRGMAGLGSGRLNVAVLDAVSIGGFHRHEGFTERPIPSCSFFPFQTRWKNYTRKRPGRRLRPA